MKNSTGKNIIITILVLIAVILLARYVVFPQQFEEWGAGLTRIQQWEDQYRADHPNATDEEVDNAFRDSIDALEQRKEDYKKNNPGASDEDADKAFNDAWSCVKK